MFTRLLFSLFLCFASVTISALEPTHAPLPSWVKPCSFSLEPTALKFWEHNHQYLLSDVQQNWEEKTTYYHFATKTITQAGVSSLAQIQIDFEPSYQQLSMHSIGVWRGQNRTERLPEARQSLLQREPLLENGFYYGTQTLVYLLDDIREGDIVEYAYSVKGEHPSLTSRYADVFFLQNPMASIHRVYRRLLFDPSFSFEMKTFNTSFQPQITSLSPHLCEWSWELSHPQPYFYEPHQPSWYFPIEYVQLSSYRTWGEVVAQFLHYYVLPSDLASNPGEEMRALIEKWQGATSDELEQARLALRFVQNEISYFALAEGIHGFCPKDPRTTLQNRAGDCKDKTFLLHAFLHLMGISSTPVLVNVNRGELLSTLLPAPMFDHIILRIEKNGRFFWTDPTWTNQGGDLEINAFPDFHWGLPLSKETTDLVPLPKPTLENPIEIKTEVKLLSLDTAQMKVRRKFHGAKADVIRNYLKWLGHLYISSSFLNEIQKTYGKASLLSRSLEDDTKGNVVTLVDTYRIPLHRKGVFKIHPIVANGYLMKGFNPDRHSPLALTYPLWVKEEIEIENPSAHWTSSWDTQLLEHESLRYQRTQRREGHHITLSFELKHLKDHVPTSSMQEFWSLTQQVDSTLVFEVK